MFSLRSRYVPILSAQVSNSAGLVPSKKPGLVPSSLGFVVGFWLAIVLGLLGGVGGGVGDDDLDELVDTGGGDCRRGVLGGEFAGLSGEPSGVSGFCP